MSKEMEAIEAAEDDMINQFMEISRQEFESTWNLKDADLARLEFNEDDYLVAVGVKKSRVLEHTGEGTDEEEWIIEVGPDLDIDLSPEDNRYRVYQFEGEWIVETP